MACAADDVSDEYRVKAAFLYNVMKFVQWPAAEAAEVQHPLTFCVVGTDPFGEHLDRALADRQAQGRPLVVARFEPDGDADRLVVCNLLFLGASERDRAAELIAALIASPVLTVSEWEGFAAAGGILEMQIVDAKLAFAVNLRAADVRGLRISSQLLKLAKQVHR